MKKLVLINILLLCTITYCAAQGNVMYPIGDSYMSTLNIENESTNIHYPGNLYLGSTQGNAAAGGSFSIEGNSSVNIKAKAVNLKNTHLGDSDPSFNVHVSGNRMSIASNYSSVNGTPQVQLYEKIEFGIELPIEIQQQIDIFLASNTSAADATHPGLNPYDPEDISIEANISSHLSDAHLIAVLDANGNPMTIPVSYTAYAFYYQEASANAANTGWDVNNSTIYPFRIRFAPPYLGTYKVTFKIIYKSAAGYQTINLAGIYPILQNVAANVPEFAFSFIGVPNTSGKAIAKGYLEVGHHKRHLRHGYDKTSFFAIGMNLPELPDGQNGHDDTPSGYNRRRDLLFQKLANNSGNYVRLLSFSFINSIENISNVVGMPGVGWIPSNTVKKLGNYQTSQQHMSETDADVSKCEDLGLFIHFCLQLHYQFMDVNPYGHTDDRWETNAYNIELNLDPNNTTNVKEFFTNAGAKRFFKNKLRYAQARWGYSAAISAWQLCSEVNIFGTKNDKTPWSYDSPIYDNDYAIALHSWNLEMSNYVAGLYPKHLLNTTYAGNPFYNNSSNILYGNFASCADKSFTNPNMDIISWNDYNWGASEDKNRTRFEDVYNIIYNEDNTNCGMGTRGYFIEKPLLHTEVGRFKGSPDLNIDKCTGIEMHNEIWAGAMSGQLGTPLEWNYNVDIDVLDQNYFPNFNALSAFMTGIDFETHKYRPTATSIDNLTQDKDEEDMQLEIYVMGNDNSGIFDHSDMGFGWVHHKQATYKSETSGFISNSCLPANAADGLINAIDEKTYEYNISGFKAGNYLIESYSTENGGLIFSSNDNDDIHATIFNKLKLTIPNKKLYKNSDTDKLLDYSFKFWHASQNGNDLRINQNSTVIDTTQNSQEIVLPGDDDKLKTYFLASFYPNPASDVVTIMSVGQKIKQVKLRDLTGKEMFVLDNIIANTTTDISISAIAAGIYYLSVKSEEGITKIFKVAKQ